MFYKDGDFSIQQSWKIQDLLKNKDSANEQHDQVSKNIDKSKRRHSKEEADLVHDSIDNEIANRIIRDLHNEGGFKKNPNPILVPKLPQTNIPKSGPTKGTTPLQSGNKAHGPSSGSHSNLPKSKDGDVLTLMAQRLSKLEMTNNSQREEIRDQAQTIINLQEEVIVLKLSSNAEETLKLKAENDKLKKQVQEMEKFLADYGLKWIGSENNKERRRSFDINSVNKDLEHAKPHYRTSLPKEIDMVVVTRRVEELNMLAAHDGEDVIVKIDGAHQFKKREPLPIAFFKDGMIIKGFPFYKYSAREAQQILEDILEGYYPSILKQKYPDGTFFKLFNKLDTEYKNAATKNFMMDFGGLEEKDIVPESREDLLNRLPKQIISKNGKIIPIRDEVAKTFEKNDGKQVSHPADKEVEGEVTITSEVDKKLQKGELTPEETEKVINLKIRTETGKRTLLLKILITDKISHLYTLIKSNSETKDFEIWGGYPPQAYKNDAKKTLEDLEIVDDSVFNLRPVSH